MDLEHAQTLIALVETASISAAADRLGVARPTVRRRLEALEDALGVKLVVSEEGNIVPTKAGSLYVENAQRLVRDHQLLHDMVRNLADDPRGTLDIALPIGIGNEVGAYFLSVAMRTYPNLDFRIRSATEPAREIDRGAHGAVTTELPPGGDFLVRAIASVEYLLFASEKYLELAGTPETASDLQHHTLLLWSELHDPPTTWPLRTGALLPIRPRFTCSNFQPVRDAVHHGLGIALLPRVLSKDLLPVLPQEVGMSKTIWWVATKTSAADARMQSIHAMAENLFKEILSTAGG